VSGILAICPCPPLVKLAQIFQYFIMPNITFKTHYQTEYGQNLYLIGNIPLLGDWDPRKGVKMTYNHRDNHGWSVTLGITEKSFSFKFCILDDRAKNGGVPLMDPSPPTLINITSEESKVIEQEWGSKPLTQEIKLFKARPSISGKLYRSPMPFSVFDPLKNIYQNYHMFDINIIVCLSWQTECQHRTGGMDLLEVYGRDGFAVIYFPINDFEEPDNMAAFKILIEKLEKLLRMGCNIVVHCHAGIGRTGLLLACLGKRFKEIEEKEMIHFIRNQIPGAMQTEQQVKFVEKFH